MRRQRAFLRSMGCGLAAASLAGLALTAAPSASAKAPASWWDYTRPATYQSIASSTSFTTGDGTKLACTVRRPGIAGEPSAGKFPSLVVQYWAFALASEGLTVEPEYFTERGYVTVVCNVRGTGGSEGTYPGMFQPIETQDNYELIEWIAGQPWSNGRVGQEGQSYGGMSSLRVAALKPPHLTAISPQFPAASVYSEFLYPGGIPSVGGRDIADAIDYLSGGRTDPVAQRELWAEHPLYDSYWKQLIVQPKLPEIDIPSLVQGGWYDYVRTGEVRVYQGLKNAWLVDGPWYHFGGVDWSTDTPPAENLPRGVFLAFFDRWVGGISGAPKPPSRVRAFELPEVGGHGWTQLDDFPPSDVHEARKAFATSGGLSKIGGAAGTRTYTVNANDGPAAVCSPEPSPEAPSPCNPFQDEQEQDTLRVTFTTPPLAHDTVLAGAPTVVLRAALTAANGNLVARVSDVSPDGSVREASVGYLRASHRLSHSFEVSLVPGKFYEYRISIDPLFWRFSAGHRLRISLSSGDVPRIDPTAEAGQVTIKTGVGGSYVELPIRH